ncbi:MAG: hypothetical protein NTZ16_10110 [Verrucomicrobia bacterium]|nr:hypothetical protein [Verrucomicrobiota bacterium]
MKAHTPTLGAIIVVTAVLLLLGGYFIWFFRRSRSLLNQWASQHEYQIVHSELRWLFQGPFFGLACKCQTVYRIKVRDQQGHERLGWVLCGSGWSGLFSNQVRVEWDDTNQAEIKVGNQLAIYLLIFMIIVGVGSAFLSTATFDRLLPVMFVICAAFVAWRIFR